MVELVGEGKTKLKNQLKIPFQSPTSHKFFFKNLFNMTLKAQATKRIGLHQINTFMHQVTLSRK